MGLGPSCAHMQSMVRLLAFFVALMAAVSAQALSCRAPNAARGFNFAMESVDKYHMVEVTFDQAGPDVPPVKIEDQAKPREPVTHVYQTPARLHQPRGPAISRDITLTVEVTCLGMWCGSFPPQGNTLLMFAKVGARDAYHVRLGACPDDLVLYAPSAKQIETLRACWREGACGPNALAQFE